MQTPVGLRVGFLMIWFLAPDQSSLMGIAHESPLRPRDWVSRPRDSLGKPLPRLSRRVHLNTIFTLFFPLVCAVLSCSVPAFARPPGSSVHGDSPGKNNGVGCHAFLQGIFPTQGLNPGLPHCRRILYHLSHQGSPWILAWVAYPFSRGSSQPRNRSWVSCTAGGFFFFCFVFCFCFFFTSGATREAPTFDTSSVTIFFPSVDRENSGLGPAVAPEVHSSWSDRLCGIQASEQNWGQSPASAVFIALEHVCSSVRGQTNPPSFLAAGHWPYWGRAQDTSVLAALRKFSLLLGSSGLFLILLLFSSVCCISVFIILVVANVYWTPQLPRFSSVCSTWVSSSSFQLYELTTFKIPLYGWGSESWNTLFIVTEPVRGRALITIRDQSSSSCYEASVPLTLPPPHPHASPSPGRLSSILSVWVPGLCAVLQAVSSEMALG